MIVVLVGEEGAAALAAGVEGATEIHCVGFVPDTRIPVAVHKDGEAAVAARVMADDVIGGDPAVWGLPETPETTPEIISDAPKRRGRPPKVKV